MKSIKCFLIHIVSSFVRRLDDEGFKTSKISALMWSLSHTPKHIFSDDCEISTLCDPFILIPAYLLLPFTLILFHLTLDKNKRHSASEKCVLCIRRFFGCSDGAILMSSEQRRGRHAHQPLHTSWTCVKLRKIVSCEVAKRFSSTDFPFLLLLALLSVFKNNKTNSKQQRQ